MYPAHTYEAQPPTDPVGMGRAQAHQTSDYNNHASSVVLRPSHPSRINMEDERFTTFGTPVEIVRLFGGKAAYLTAIRELEGQLYQEAA